MKVKGLQQVEMRKPDNHILMLQVICDLRWYQNKNADLETIFFLFEWVADSRALDR